MVSPFRGSGPFRGRGPFLGRGPWAGKAPWGFNLGGVAWSPATLFASGEQGAWYDPADLSTLRQDSAGTTAVTAVEQPVGLMLDKSRGLVLGSELVTFASLTASAEWTFGGGVWTLTNSSTNSQTLAFISLTAGNWYEISVTVTSISGGALNFRHPTNSTPIAGGPSITAPGTYTIKLLASSTAVWVRNSTTAQTIVVSAFSVRELPGNHAFNPNATTVRPVLSARYNLLTYSEQFDNAAWRKSNIAITANAATAPDGTLTADKATIAASTAVTEVASVSGVTVPLGVVTVRARVKADGVQYFNCGFIYSAGIYSGTQFDLTNGTIVRTAAAVYSGAVATIEAVGNDGWYVCTHTVTVTTTSVYPCILPSNALWTAGEPRQTLTGNGADGVYIWGADLRVANESATIPYQRVVTATDYDADPTKFPYYLRFDGSDDWLQTASIDFSTVTSDGQPRRNLLTFPTAFDESAWTKSEATVTQNVTLAPDGTLTADALIESVNNARHGVYQFSASAGSGNNTFSVIAKANTRSWLGIRVDGATSYFDIGNGELGTAASGCTLSITSEGNGWYRCIVTKNWLSNQNCWVIVASADNTEIYTGNGTSSIYIWGAQLETGSTATAFQNIGTDKMSVFAGVRKLSDAATGTIVELSANPNTNAGSFTLGNYNDDGTAGPRYNFRAGGVSLANMTVAEGFAAPITNVLTGTDNIAANAMALRVDGAERDTDGGSQGGGNFGNYPLYIGRRGGTTIPFNGRLYSLLVLGRTATVAEITSAETYVAAKTGVVLP